MLYNIFQIPWFFSSFHQRRLPELTAKVLFNAVLQAVMHCGDRRWMATFPDAQAAVVRSIEVEL